MMGDSNNAALIRNIGLVGAGMGITLIALQLTSGLKKSLRGYFGRNPSLFKDTGSDPVDSDAVPAAKKDSSTNTDAKHKKKKESAGSPNKQSDAPNMDPNMPDPATWPFLGIDSPYNHHPSINTENSQGGALGENGLFPDGDTAQFLLDAGKYYLSSNCQITGIMSIKDVLAVCDYPHRFYNDVRRYFDSQGAWHLSRILEADSEVQSILKSRSDPNDDQMSPVGKSPLFTGSEWDIGLYENTKAQMTSRQFVPEDQQREKGLPTGATSTLSEETTQKTSSKNNEQNQSDVSSGIDDERVNASSTSENSEQVNDISEISQTLETVKEAGGAVEEESYNSKS